MVLSGVPIAQPGEPVRVNKECQFCPGVPAVVLLKPKVDGLELKAWDRLCLSCAEKSIRHWKKHNVTWRKKAIREAARRPS